MKKEERAGILITTSMPVLVTVVLAVLKLTGVKGSWSWWTVFSPITVFLALVLLIAVLIVVVAPSGRIK